MSTILKIPGPISIDLCGMPMISIDQVVLCERLGPFSGRMINAQNLNLFPLDTIRNDIGYAVNDQFACTPHSSFPTHLRMIPQLIHCDANVLHDLKCPTWIFSRDVFLNGEQGFRSRRRPTNAHGQASLYLLKIASISASEANRPASAALTPSLIRSSCQASRSRYWSIAWFTR